MEKLIKIFTVLFLLCLVSCNAYKDYFVIDEHDGKDGSNGHSDVFGSRPMMNGTNVIGNYLDIYWDMDSIGTPGYGVLSEKDVWKYTVPISNGITPDFKVSSEKFAGGMIYHIYVNGSLNSTDTIHNGNTGATGDHPTLKEIHYSNGIVYQWFVGNEKVSNDFFPYAVDGKNGHDGKDGVNGTDGTNGENGKDGTNGQDGKDGAVGTSLPCLTQPFNFQGVNQNYFTNTGIVVGGFIYSEVDGALYCGSNGGSIILPPTTENNKLIYFSFKYGTKKSFKITVKVIHYDTSEELISSFGFAGNSNFQRNVFSTYGKFEYKADISNIRFANVKNIKIEVTKNSLLKCNDLEDLFIDDPNTVVIF